MNEEFFVNLLQSVYIRVHPWFIFLFRLMDGGRLFYAVLFRKTRVSIRAPRAGGDCGPAARLSSIVGFNPRPPGRGRFRGRKAARSGSLFQSAPPGQGAINASAMWRRSAPFQSAPPGQGAMAGGNGVLIALDVSIRAPRAGGDKAGGVAILRECGFNPRPPGRGRSGYSVASVCVMSFQSAPPGQGAMVSTSRMAASTLVSIRAPRVGGDLLQGMDFVI